MLFMKRLQHSTLQFVEGKRDSLFLINPFHQGSLAGQFSDLLHVIHSHIFEQFLTGLAEEISSAGTNLQFPAPARVKLQIVIRGGEYIKNTKSKR